MFGCGIGGISTGSFTGWAFIPMILRSLIFIGLVYLAIRFFKSNGSDSRSAINILNEKYANGEISEDEYIKRKDVLHKSK